MTDEELAEWTESQLADDLARAACLGATCTVCHTNWVDAFNGEDTCAECLRRQ